MHNHVSRTPSLNYSQVEQRSDGDEQNSASNKRFSENDVEQMLLAEKEFEHFNEELGEVKVQEIRGDVLEHCDRLKINLLNFDEDYIKRLIKNRIEKMIKNKRIKKNWSAEDLKILAWIVSKYSDYKVVHNVQKDLASQDWRYIASLIPGVTADSCMFKWLSLKKNNLTSNGWSQRESHLLQKVVKQTSSYGRKYGEKDWGLVSQKLYFLNNSTNKIYRCAKQCRQHWNCYLNPNLKKGPWTKEEDLHLLNLIKKNNCQKKWAEMVSDFRGRTENALKNRFTLIIEKEIKINPKHKKLSELEIIEEYLSKSYVQQFVQSNQKNEKAEEGMRTRRRQNLQVQVETINSPVHPEPNEGEKRKENIQVSDFDKTKLERMFSEELSPNIENMQVITLKSEEIGELTEKILQQKSEYVPCTFDNNKLKRIFKL